MWEVAKGRQRGGRGVMKSTQEFRTSTTFDCTTNACGIEKDARMPFRNSFLEWTFKIFHKWDFSGTDLDDAQQ